MPNDWMHTMLAYDIFYPVSFLNILSGKKKTTENFDAEFYAEVKRQITDIHFIKRYDFASDGNCHMYNTFHVTGLLFIKHGEITHEVKLDEDKILASADALLIMNKLIKEEQICNFYTVDEMIALQDKTIVELNKYSDIFKILKIE